jgi:hypothetical protein
MKFALPILALLSLSLPLQAVKNRGVWFWRDTGNPCGAATIVGNATTENATITFLTANGIKHVYGSYEDRPVSEPAVISTWNTKLHTAGIQSQFLMSENTWILTANRPALLALITQRLINFNNTPGRTAVQKFDGLHLDIEPQGLPDWTTATPAQKRSYLTDLQDTYTAVRAHLTAAGMTSFPIHADLPVWFDNLITDGGSVGWLDATDRDTWFADIATTLTGISLMPFDRLTFSSINHGVTWERANITGAVVRCGIEADIGTGKTWPTVPNFKAMIETMETAYTPAGAVDIQSYRKWREALAAQPLIGVSVAFKLASPATGGDIIFTGEAGWTYVISHSSDLCSWAEVQRVKPTPLATIQIPVTTSEPRGFWKVEKFQDLPF